MSVCTEHFSNRTRAARFPRAKVIQLIGLAFIKVSENLSFNLQGYDRFFSCKTHVLKIDTES